MQNADILLVASMSFIAIIVISLIFSSPPVENPQLIDKTISSCINGRIGGLGTSSTSTTPVSGYRFDIVLPNGECKNDVMLSVENYTKMQNNVGYFTVKNKQFVTSIPTTGYCPLEKWIWEGHLGIYNMTKYEKWMLTDYCKPKHFVFLNDSLSINDNIEKPVVVPEFGTVAMMILVISIISIIIISTKSKVIPRF